jgi:hypothetical protein
VGLVAVLLGALWNAHLTRRRDALMREEETKAISAAIGAEMSAYIRHVTVFMSGLGPHMPKLSEHAYLQYEAPTLHVWPKLCDKVGYLAPDLSYEVVSAWARLEFYGRALQASVAETIHDQLDKSAFKSRCDYIKSDLPALTKLVGKLTDREPPYFWMPGMPPDPALLKTR